MCKKLLCGALCILLLGTISFTAAAKTDVLTISSAEEFLDFAQNCRLDSYSYDMNVKLEANIDLSGTEFSGIPIFCGTFDGGGHTICGLALEGRGSVQGLFRYLSDTALVQNLNVRGTVTPKGSRDTVGGIAGSNSGRIENCSFDGQVSGGDRVGGIVGINGLAGVVENCHTGGSVHGNHFIGGVVGDNQGVIRNCENAAKVNTTAVQNSVDISDITIESITGTESGSAATDIGGIAGISAGVIRGCKNTADVGYKHMGYNVGGIAGSQTGYLVDCENYGRIFGRKEVGGILGQLEPAATVRYSEDTLQILKGQMDTLNKLIDAAADNAQTSANAVKQQLTVIEDHIAAARQALDVLTLDADNLHLPEADALLAAVNTLQSSLSGIQTGLKNLVQLTGAGADALGKDLEAIQKQIDVINATLNNGSENLGGSITDVSDADTAEDKSAKVEACSNYGPVQADLNAGGIVGAVAIESDLDPEADVSISGNSSLNFAGELRAVILSCRNSAEVTVKKQNIGGITGWLSMGLAKGCVNTGAVTGNDADYVGGIVGRSSGSLRFCSAKAVITGDAYVGGIAGSGTVASDCRAMVLLDGTEKLGAILGYTETREEITGNAYAILGADPGAIDGVSYYGSAHGFSMEDFLMLDDLHEVFRQITVQFLFEDGKIHTVQLTPGEALQQTDIPAVPAKDGYIGYWAGLTTDITFDTVFSLAYTPHTKTLESQQQRENRLPILLVQGAFSPTQALTAVQLTEEPGLQQGQTWVESWMLDMQQELTVRYLPPAGYDPAQLQLMVRASDGQWQEAAFRVDGSYLVFALQETDDAFCLLKNATDYSIYIFGACTFLAAAGTTAAIYLGVKSHRKKNSC